MAVALLTTKEVGKLLRRSRNTIHRWTRDRKMPQPIRIDGRPLWRAADIEAFIARGACGSESDRAAAGR